MISEQKQYSLNELNTIANSLNSLLARSKESDVEYSRNLLYSLSKNLRIIEEEVKTISKQLQDDDPQFEEYRNELFKAASECGGEVKPNNQGGQFVDMQVDSFDKVKFDKKREELNEKFVDVIKNQEKIQSENEKTKREAVAEPDWHSISLNYFPETGSIDDIPYVINDLIKE